MMESVENLDQSIYSKQLEFDRETKSIIKSKLIDQFIIYFNLR
jgi:hypothetical protein